MRRQEFAIIALAAMFGLASPAASWAQGRGGNGGGGQAVPRGGSSGGGEEARAAAGAPSSSTSASAGANDNNGDRRAVPTYSRPRGDHPVTGEAVPRPPGSYGSGNTYII